MIRVVTTLILVTTVFLSRAAESNARATVPITFIRGQVMVPGVGAPRVP